MYIGFHVKQKLFSTDLNEISIYGQIFEKKCKYQIS